MICAGRETSSGCSVDTHVRDSEAQRLSDEQREVDGQEVEAECGAEMSEPEHVDRGGADHGKPGHAEAGLAPGGGSVTAEVLQLRLTDPEVT